MAHVLCRPSLPRAATRKAYCVAARSPVTSMPVAAVDRSTCSGRAAASEADDSAYLANKWRAACSDGYGHGPWCTQYLIKMDTSTS